MSWGPRPEAIKNQVIPAKDADDLKRKSDRMQRLDKHVKKLHQDVKRFADSLTALQNCQQRLAHDLGSLQSPTLHDHCMQFKETTSANSRHANEYGETLKEDCSLGLKKLNHACTGFNHAEKAIDHALQECVKYTHKVQKYQKMEQTSANTLKLNENGKIFKYQASLRRSKYELENAHNSLNGDLTTFLNAHNPLMQPIFEAMAHAQNDYFTRSLTAWSNLLENLTRNENLTQIDGDKCQQNLQHIKALSIVSDTKPN